jgi:hypothetical protein
LKVIAMLNLIKNRIHTSDQAMPEWLLVFFVLCGVLIPLFYLYVLKLVAPTWLAIAAEVAPGEWGWQGLLLTLAFGVLGLLAWNTAVLARQCAGLLGERWSGTEAH